jgi:S-adenosylmethionine synthetase
MKVMGLRDGEDITLTICSGMIGKYIDDLNSYVSMTEEMKAYTEELAARYTERDVKVYINTGDNLKTGSVFLTVTGTSAEMGDDGSVGRGNRCNGLITPNRPMSMEATSGKNPINHIGKIYNLLSTQMARDIVKQVPDVQDVYIRLLSQIGKPIDQPLVASAQIIPVEGTSFDKVKAETEVIIDDWLTNVTKITEMVIKGELNTF